MVIGASLNPSVTEGEIRSALTNYDGDITKARK
jgi:hypothetical protein